MSRKVMTDRGPLPGRVTEEDRKSVIAENTREIFGNSERRESRSWKPIV